MKFASAYLAELLTQCADAKWNLRSIRTGSADIQREKLKGTLGFFNQMAQYEALEQQLLASEAQTSLSESIQDLADQLKIDLAEYIPPVFDAEYQQSHIVFLPLPSVDGFCLNRDQDGNLLDGFVIGLNEGLWVCAQLLAKGFVLENLQGDLAAWHRSGKSCHDNAVAHWLQPASHHAQQIFFDHMPPEPEGMASAAQSAMAVLILQFVTLHEFGHIAHQDLALMDAYRFHIGANDMVPDGPVADFWQAEYAADAFALEAICRHAKHDISRWANFITIYIFFAWLDSIETAIGQALCPYHPLPAMRAKRLEAWMREHYPPNTEIDGHFEMTQIILQRWRGEAFKPEPGHGT